MKKLKIGLFIDSFFPMVDGVVMVVDNYARRLCQSAEVTVFAPGSKQKGFDDSVFPYRVVRSKILKVPKLDYVLPCPGLDRKFKRAMEEADLDIVHLHSPATIGRAGLAHARRHNIPVVAHMHSQFKRDFSAVVSWKWFVSLMMKYAMKIYNRCDVCWAVNGEIARLLYEDYGCKVKPTVQRNATEMLPLEDPQKARALDERYGILPGEKVFLFVGRLVLVKGILFLADALKVLKDRGLKFRMFFVGSGQEGEIRLRKRLEELELSECILTGSVEIELRGSQSALDQVDVSTLSIGLTFDSVSLGTGTHTVRGVIAATGLPTGVTLVEEDVEVEIEITEAADAPASEETPPAGDTEPQDGTTPEESGGGT